MMDGAGYDHKNGIQVISRAARILRILGEDQGGLSLGQIATKAELPRSTVQRIVAALTAEGFVTANEGHGSLTLGPAFRSLAGRQEMDTKTRLRPVLRQIATQTGETADLALLDGDGMLFVDQIEGSQRLRTVSSIGERFPLTTTANGKAALALLEETEAARLSLAELQRAPGAGPNLTDLLTDLRDIRAGELALDRDAHTDGICALGFALRDDKGDVYAISVPVPSTRFARISERLHKVLSTARDQLQKAG